MMTRSKSSSTTKAKKKTQTDADKTQVDTDRLAKDIVAKATQEGGDAETVKTANLPPKPVGLAKPKSRKGDKKPAWVKFYEGRKDDTSSSYFKGFSQTFDYFEIDLMANYVDSPDDFVDTIRQNDECCALIFPDPMTGKIRIIHHLTVAAHGSTIIVGVDGMGSTSEVKEINIQTFSERVDLGLIDKGMKAPLPTDIAEGSSNSNDGENDDPTRTLGDVLENCANGYLLHPIWMKLIYRAVGRTPKEAITILIESLQVEFNSGQDYLNDFEKLEDYYFEMNLLLVYLWACQHKKFELSRSDITKTYEDQAFKDIQNSILKKILTPSRVEVSRERVEEEGGETTQRQNKERNPSPEPSPSASPPPERGRRSDRGREGRKKRSNPDWPRSDSEDKSDDSSRSRDRSESSDSSSSSDESSKRSRRKDRSKRRRSTSRSAGRGYKERSRSRSKDRRDKKRRRTLNSGRMS